MSLDKWLWWNNNDIVVVYLIWLILLLLLWFLIISVLLNTRESHYTCVQIYVSNLPFMIIIIIRHSFTYVCTYICASASPDDNNPIIATTNKIIHLLSDDGRSQGLIIHIIIITIIHPLIKIFDFEFDKWQFEFSDRQISQCETQFFKRSQYNIYTSIY